MAVPYLGMVNSEILEARSNSDGGGCLDLLQLGRSRKIWLPGYPGTVTQVTLGLHGMQVAHGYVDDAAIPGWGTRRVLDTWVRPYWGPIWGCKRNEMSNSRVV